jgi:hypothetical protein
VSIHQRIGTETMHTAPHHKFDDTGFISAVGVKARCARPRRASQGTRANPARSRRVALCGQRTGARAAACRTQNAGGSRPLMRVCPRALARASACGADDLTDGDAGAAALLPASPHCGRGCCRAWRTYSESWPARSQGTWLNLLSGGGRTMRRCMPRRRSSRRAFFRRTERLGYGHPARGAPGPAAERRVPRGGSGPGTTRPRTLRPATGVMGQRRIGSACLSVSRGREGEGEASGGFLEQQPADS